MKNTKGQDIREIYNKNLKQEQNNRGIPQYEKKMNNTEKCIKNPKTFKTDAEKRIAEFDALCKIADEKLQQSSQK